MYYAQAFVNGKIEAEVRDLGKNIRSAKTQAYENLSHLVSGGEDYILIFKAGDENEWCPVATFATTSRCKMFSWN